MSEGINLGSIAPGTPVYGVGGESIGPVEANDSTGIRVLGHTVPAKAIARVDTAGVHLHLGRPAFQTAPPESSGEVDAAQARAQPSEVASDRLVVPVVEERLVVGTRMMQVGEVTIEKRVVEEQVMVPVTVRREEIEIIRRAPGEPRTEVDDPTIVEIIRIPLRGEEAVISTEAVVVRELVIGREVRTEERQVVGTVRSTEITVDEPKNEGYTQSRPIFEAHFAERQRVLRESSGASYRTRDFRDAEPNYRAGFAAGRDERYAGRSFEESESEVLGSVEPSSHEPSLLDQLRAEVREGFSHARGGGTH